MNLSSTLVRAAMAALFVLLLTPDAFAQRSAETSSRTSTRAETTTEDTRPRSVVASPGVFLSATPIGEDTVELEWNLNANNSFNDVFQICWKEAGAWWPICSSNSLILFESEVESLGDDHFSFVVDGLDCDTAYRFKVYAGNSWELGYGFHKLTYDHTTITFPCDWDCFDECPFGGLVDGDGCQYGVPPAGTEAFVYDYNYYYTPVGTCPMRGSYFDGANCFLQRVSGRVSPFIHNNSFYYHAMNGTCPEGGWFDGAHCYLGGAPVNTEAFIYNGAFYYTPMPTCPMSGSYYDGANCFWQEVPQGASPYIYDNAWYYEACPG